MIASNQDLRYEEVPMHGNAAAFNNRESVGVHSQFSIHQAMNSPISDTEKHHKLKVSQLLEKHKDDPYNQFYNYIFYGVVLEKMQK